MSAAKVLGVSRNTVRARMERVESLLRTDFTDLTVRATVHLALSTQVSLADGQAAPRARGRPAPGWVICWPGPPWRPGRGNCSGAWTATPAICAAHCAAGSPCGGNAERAAQTLAVHAQTVREHVRSAEPVLERQLIASGGDLYEVVLAHLATGELEHPVSLRDDPGHSDSPVHG